MSVDDDNNKMVSNTSLKNDNKVDLNNSKSSPKKSSVIQKGASIENDSIKVSQETEFAIQKRLTGKIDRNKGTHIFIYDKCENKHEIEHNSSMI